MKLKKILVTVIIISTMFTIPAMAGEWEGQADGRWKYLEENSYISDQWFKDTDGSWYHFDENGYMQCNQWAMDDGAWYYLGADGKLLTDSSTPDGYYVGPDGIWVESIPQESEEPEAYSNLVYPVDIMGGGFVMDSVGGVDPYVGFRNNSGKDIKYITMEMTPFNRVDDPVSCTIRGYSTTTCTATGPYKPDVGIGQGMYSITSGAVPVLGRNTDHPYYYTTRSFDKMELDPSQYAKTFTAFPGWENVWYNNNIHKIIVTKVNIDYMDGTSDVLSNLYIPLFYDSTLE